MTEMTADLRDRETGRGAHGDVEPALGTELLAATRAARRAFLVAVEDHRPALFGYCRRLTGDVWDAEDLVQETLTKAFTVAAQTHYPIEKPLAWLVRVATNTWIDQHRRRREVLGVPEDRPAPEPADPAEVQDALSELVRLLAPQERAALVLKDVFGYPVAEIAELVGTTEGAVKAALHRGRGRLNGGDRTHRRERRAAPSRQLLQQVADAFNSYDIPRMTELFLERATSEVVGMVSEDGAPAIAEGSFAHTFSRDLRVRFRAEVHEHGREPVIVLFETELDESGAVVTQEAPSDVLRFEADGDRVAAVRWYYFCPETLTEVGLDLGLTMKTNGYRYD